MTADAGCRPLTESFFWPGDEIGCLLVHGFTGTPYDMYLLAERLHALGHTVHAVRLAGHGTTVADLGGCRWTDWYASVEEGLGVLARRARTVIALGQSLGSALVFRLAYARPREVHGVVSLASALILANPWAARLAALPPPVTRLLPRRGLCVHTQGSDIADPEARRRHAGYDRMPVRSIVEVARLHRQVRALLPRITQPVLALHGRHDHTAPLANLALLERTLPNLRAAIVLENSCHVVSVDADRDRMAGAVTSFVADTAVHCRAAPSPDS